MQNKPNKCKLGDKHHSSTSFDINYFMSLAQDDQDKPATIEGHNMTKEEDQTAQSVYSKKQTQKFFKDLFLGNTF